MSRVLIIEDEQAIAELEKDYLELSGFEVVVENDGAKGCEIALAEDFDIFVLDLMLPGMDGYDICKAIREEKNTPILMVSAKKDDIDKIRGLGLGADDYITKPFQIREVMARVKANLRKAELNTNYENTQKQKDENLDSIIKVGDLTLDTKKVEVRVKDEVVNLTKKEFDVLKYLATRPGQVVTREMLLREVWEYEEYVGAIRTIDVTMNRIRDKIEKDKSNPKILITKRGVGYYVTDKD